MKKYLAHASASIHSLITMSNQTAEKPFNTFDFVMDFEGGNLFEEEVISGFQELINSGFCWTLQGVYGRTAIALIAAGHCTPAKVESKPITLHELVQVSNSYTVVLPDGTLVFVQHGQYDDIFGIQLPDDELLWYLYGRETKAQVVAALEVLLNEGETWEPWHVTAAIEEAA